MNAPAEDSDSVALAVVIPAWRAQFLGATLDSLRAQTDQRFRVYVGDDASPDDIVAVVARHGPGLDLVYHRFAENLGSRDLVAQWHRCIDLTRGEPWVWVFSDDDEMEPECVAAFYQTLTGAKNRARLLRFDFSIINESGAIVRRPTPNPARESDGELLRSMLRGGGREWRAPEHLFARTVYDERGGFVSFPRALFSDLATWVEFARDGVATIPGARVRWRSHEAGTSTGLRRQHQPELLHALLGFAEWIARWRQTRPGEIEGREALRFLLLELGRVHPPVPWRLTATFLHVARSLTPELPWRTLAGVPAAVLFSRLRHLPGLAWWITRRYRRRLSLDHPRVCRP